MDVKAESALENEAEIMPNTKQMPTIGDMTFDTINGIILSGASGSAMPESCEYVIINEPKSSSMKLIGKNATP